MADRDYTRSPVGRGPGSGLRLWCEGVKPASLQYLFCMRGRNALAVNSTLDRAGRSTVARLGETGAALTKFRIRVGPGPTSS